jgi:type II secretory pathway pseudopilin PulG
MKPTSPHDPLDDLFAAALHGELTPEERAQLDAHLQNDPAAHAAYLEALAMHDMLNGSYQNAQPDPAFEQRMVSGVRRKIQHEEHRETAWESLLVLWAFVKKFPRRFRLIEVAVVLVILAVLAGVALGPITHGIKQSKESAAMQMEREAELQTQAQGPANSQLADAGSAGQSSDGSGAPAETASVVDAMPAPMTINAPPTTPTAPMEPMPQAWTTPRQALGGAGTYSGSTTVSGGRVTVDGFNQNGANTDSDGTTVSGVMLPPSGTISYSGSGAGGGGSLDMLKDKAAQAMAKTDADEVKAREVASDAPLQAYLLRNMAASTTPPSPTHSTVARSLQAKVPSVTSTPDGIEATLAPVVASPPAPPSTTTTTAAVDDRKLIRNAQLELEVKSFTEAMDQITALTKSAGGYVDTSNSQRGGNGKLQGVVVVKVLPQNLDDFLLKLRDLGQIKNQSISTEDVTKDYFDTQARLDNSRRMETQLQDLLTHANSKVSDLLQVERELGRVRGEIEQMQGQLKLYDFEVQYATVTMQVSEKDLNQAAAYLLKEQDDFSLFSTNVEGAFQKARQTADDFKAQILTANLNHNSGSDVTAELLVMVDPDQIDAFLAQTKALGRVANFTRQTQRVAQDGGDSGQPADQTRTEKDKVQVHLVIRSDDESRKQVALTVVTPAVDDALDKAKAAALADAGTEILSSSLNKTPQGQSTAQMSLRVPGKDYHALLETLRALGRTASFSLQRDDNAGPGADGDDAPVIISLALTDDDQPLQETNLSVLASDVDTQSQQIKKDAAAAGVEIKASSFSRQPNGLEKAQLVFRLPMANYPAFIENLKKLGKVESLTVQRQDRPDQARADDTAPVQIILRLHNQGNIVTDNNGLGATLRTTFGDGVGALLGSVRTIGVIIAFLTPWVFTLILAAWAGRRIYLWRKK